MALGDGVAWDETEPTEASEASLAPTYINDDRVGTRKRMQNEHYWPAAQTSVVQGGQHTFITLQSTATFPGFPLNNSGTSMQTGCLWIDGSNNIWYTSVGSTGNNSLMFINNGTTAGSFIPFSSISQPYVKVSNTQTSGVGGGSSTSGSWQTYVLNTVDNDTANIATLVANQITLPAGTYKVRGYASFYSGGTLGGAQIRLYNSTGAAVLINGETGYGWTTAINLTSRIEGRFTLGVTSTLILQYECVASVVTSGLGYPIGYGTEVFAVLEFEKVA